MTKYIDLSPNIIGPDQQQGVSDSWMIIEQDRIPEEQQQVTASEAKSMLSAALSGYSAFRGMSSCPVRKSGLGGNNIASYLATVLIHKSLLIDDYDLVITKDGIPIRYNFPRREYRKKSKSFDINYNKTVQLNWQTYAGFTGTWNAQFGVYDTNSSRLPLPLWPVINHYDGFVTLIGELAFGIIQVSALTIMDLVTVNIEHNLGTKWDSSVRAEVRWPAGAEFEFQNKTECEILLPSCVETAFSECSNEDEQSEDEQSEDYWDNNFKGGPSGPTKVFWNKCSQEIIEVTNDNRETL